jgi:hypothetical protein
MSLADQAYALLEPAFYLFTLKGTALVLSVGILAALVVSAAWFRGRTIRRPVRELRDATRALARIPDRSGFVEQFARIDRSSSPSRRWRRSFASQPGRMTTSTGTCAA